ncbi:MAG: imidazole glycerol phosphate synthase subunit HisH [Qipengyuania sp.]|nr:imidazole glycerol phosphate synthase subunit HisH [Qipengyuania sp.]
MIQIIDYGIGNVQAFLNVYKRLGIAAQRAIDPGQIVEATHVILPGVGSFDRAMHQFELSGFRQPLDELARGGQTHVIGVCVGMQMLADGSDEGVAGGLGLIPGRVRPIRDLMRGHLPSPHMGWNAVQSRAPHRLFEGIEDSRFYFLHSYYFDSAAPEDVIASAHYGADFTCAVGRGKVFGVQFHPEKSHHFGQQLLGNFARL